MSPFTRGLCIVGLTLFASSAMAQIAKKDSAAPKSLLIYYGYPSLINGAKKTKEASAEFSKYDFVVIAGGLEDAKHEDHRNAKAVIDKTGTTQFFGYVPLGNREGKDTCLTAKEIRGRIAKWKAMGVKGVLLDEFGFDYGVSRERQNEAVNEVHKAKLRAIANAWEPEDAFLPKDKVKPALDANDIYLWESYRIKNSEAVALNDWRKKADRILECQKELPLSVFSVSTSTEQPKNADELFEHQWYCAAIDGHRATGWGHKNYASDTKAPYVASPIQNKKPRVDLGEHVEKNAATVKDSIVTRSTSLGEISVEAEKLTGSFVPKKK